MNVDNNKFIATIIKGSNSIGKINEKVIFKANGITYIKKIKEKNKVRSARYVESESVNIICNDLNKDYVIIDSDNVVYYNKSLFSLFVAGSFSILLLTILTLAKYREVINDELFISVFIKGALAFVIFTSVLMFYSLYTVLFQTKKLYKNYTAIAEGEIICYRRTEKYHNSDNIHHCNYNVMYKFKDANGNIIRSVIRGYSAELLYKDYPISKKVMIRYNPLKSCESCLADEYDSVLNKTKFVNNSIFEIMTIATVTNIVTRCIDEDIEDDLKEYFLADFIECEYTISDTIYKTYSMFGVYHNMFKIGDKIMIYYDNSDKNKFFCDIKTKYNTLDKI